ncbi:nucleotide exchange factor GrpE [Ammonifex thiophilus]|nr:nucleotide exchange factor GrpE [Ammonifex thiophilus]
MEERDKEAKPGPNGEAQEAVGEGKEAVTEPVPSLPELEAEIQLLKEALAQAEARAEEYQRQLLRLRADFETFRRRLQQEREEILARAAENLIKNLLPILDDFERALAARGDRLEDFLQGVELIYQRLFSTLQQEGLEPIAAEGNKFDPFYHEAFAFEEKEDCEDGIILEEFRRGYLFRGKLLRPSLVKVAKAKAVETEAEEEEKDGENSGN